MDDTMSEGINPNKSIENPIFQIKSNTVST